MGRVLWVPSVVVRVRLLLIAVAGLLGVLALAPAVAAASFIQQGPKLAESGPTVAFGGSAALSADGNTALIGEPNANGLDGRVWVLTRSGGTWSVQATLVGDCTSSCGGPNGNGEAGAGNFGQSVALSADGNTALIGAYFDNGSAGAAWVFTRAAGVWSQQGSKLQGAGEVGTGAFGSSVALSADGNTALIGGSDDHGQAGAAWTFTRSGSSWTQQVKLVGDCTGLCFFQGTGESGNGGFGARVALSADGTTALIGAPADNSSAGAAWVFTLASGLWSQQGSKLVGNCPSSCNGPNGTGENGGGRFGSVALSADGNTALIGARLDNSQAGAAWVFARSSGAWSQQGSKLVGDCTSSCGGPNGVGESGSGWFGLSVALSADGNTAMIGGPFDNGVAGAVWVFARSSAAWSQQDSKLIGDCTSACSGPNGSGENGPGGLGESVALAAEGNTAVLGAPADAGGPGAAWVFVSPPVISGLSPASGPASGGTHVTIAGSSLSDATAVDFGSAPASSFTVDGPGQITATAPAGSGTVDVTVTSAAGTSATSAADRFTFTRAPNCTLKPQSSRVKVSKHAHGRHPKPPTGTVQLIASCDQAAGATLKGTVTELLPSKHRHGTPTKRTFTLTAVRITLRAGVATAVKLKLPAALVTALEHHTKQAAAFTLTATDPTGSAIANTTIGRLKH